MKNVTIWDLVVFPRGVFVGNSVLRSSRLLRDKVPLLSIDKHCLAVVWQDRDQRYRCPVCVTLDVCPAVPGDQCVHHQDLFELVWRHDLIWALIQQPKDIVPHWSPRAVLLVLAHVHW